jgi:hypothetical protein
MDDSLHDTLARFVLGKESVRMVSVGDSTMLIQREAMDDDDGTPATLYIGDGVKHLTREFLDVVMHAVEHNGGGVVVHVDTCHKDAEDMLGVLGFEHWKDSDDPRDDCGYWWPTDSPMLGAWTTDAPTALSDANTCAS